MARLLFECEDREGHRVLFETTEKEAKDLLAAYDASKQWLLDNGFSPVSARSGKPLSKQKVRFDGQLCPQCHGDVWDNRAQKQSDPSRVKWPDFACKNRATCGWVVWPGQYEIVENTA